MRKKFIVKYRPSLKHLDPGATDKSVSDISDLSYFTSKSALLAKQMGAVDDFSWSS